MKPWHRVPFNLFNLSSLGSKASAFFPSTASNKVALLEASFGGLSLLFLVVDNSVISRRA